MLILFKVSVVSFLDKKKRTCFQNMKFKDFNDNATRWLRILILYICILHNDLMRGHEDLVMLRSNTGSYG